MKKYIVSTLLFASLSFAGSDLVGVIQSIDSNKKIITVNGTQIHVLPQTKIEEDSCGLGWDTPKQFKDLKVNDLIEADVFHNNGVVTAEDIEIKCKKNLAY